MEVCCMLSIHLAVPSCFNSFWHGVIPTAFFIFNDFTLVSLIFLSNVYRHWQGDSKQAEAVIPLSRNYSASSAILTRRTLQTGQSRARQHRVSGASLEAKSTEGIVWRAA